MKYGEVTLPAALGGFWFPLPQVGTEGELIVCRTTTLVLCGYQA